MSDHIPSSRFGQSLVQYDPAPVPDLSLPHRAVQEAADNWNRHRYRELTFQQRVFIDEYLAQGFTDKAAAAAAKLANYVDANADEKVARRVGKRLLQKPYMVAALHAAMRYSEERGQLRWKHIEDELRTVAFANAGDLWKNDGVGDPYVEMPEANAPIMRSIKEIKVESYMEGRGPAARTVKSVEFKMYDKLRALETLAKVYAPNATSGDETKTGGGGSTNVTVQTINIMPVPRGQYIPAPELGDLNAIKYLPLLDDGGSVPLVPKSIPLGAAMVEPVAAELSDEPELPFDR